MSVSRLRAGLVGGGIAGMASALVATVALVGSGAGPASAQTAPYGTPSPSPSTSTSPSASPSATPSPSASPAPDPAPEAEAKTTELQAELPAATTPETRNTIAAALDSAADAFAAAGLTAEQQVAALEAMQGVINAVATRVAVGDEPGLTQAQVLAAINTVRSLTPSLLGLSEADRNQILAGLTDGILESTASLTETGTQQAVIDTVQQAVAVLAASDKLGILTADVVKQLVTVTATAVDGKTSTGNAEGVRSTTTTQPNGDIEFRFTGLKPGTTGLVVLNVANAQVAAALRAALGDSVVAYSVDPSGRATLVLVGTVNDLGQLVLSAPGSALGATTAAQAQAAIDRSTLGVVGTANNGATAVYAAPAGRPAVPTITARRTPVVPSRGAAVLTGTAQPGTTVQLLGRTSGGDFRVLRSLVVGDSGEYSFTVYPDQSYRFFVRSAANGQTVDSVSTVVSVRAYVSQSVTRTGTQAYRFTGRVSPAVGGVLVNLYRSSPSGGSVLVAQTRTAPNGAWLINRKFSGTGTFSFFTRSGNTARALGGTSSVQRIAIR